VDTSYLRAGARGVTDRTATGLEGSLMEHTDAGVRMPPMGLRTREEEEHDRTAVSRPDAAVGQRLGASGRPPVPRIPADAHATAELRVPGRAAYTGRVAPDTYDLVRPAPGATQATTPPAPFATARRVEAVATASQNDRTEGGASPGGPHPGGVAEDYADDEVDDIEDEADDDLDADDSDDDADAELDDEADAGLPLAGGAGDRESPGGQGRPMLAEVIDIGLGDLLGEVMEWQERALCAQTDPEAFFPEKGGSTREAKRICSGCEVRAECLEYALANDERFGIWGGMSERERRKQRRRAV